MYLHVADFFPVHFTLVFKLRLERINCRPQTSDRLLLLFDLLLQRHSLNRTCETTHEHVTLLVGASHCNLIGEGIVQFLATSDLRRRHFEFVRRFLSVLLNLALLLITPLLQFDTTHKIVTSLMTCHINKTHKLTVPSSLSQAAFWRL